LEYFLAAASPFHFNLKRKQQIPILPFSLCYAKICEN